MTDAQTAVLHLDEPTELVDAALYRLGASVDASDAISWVPPGTVGSLPLNVYVLRSARRALVVDTGPAVLYPAIIDPIRELVGSRDCSICVTRNDPEAVGGLGWLVPQLHPSELLYYGGGSLLEWVWDAATGPDGAGDLFGALPVSDAAHVDLGGGISLRVLRPPVSVLNTVWLYDSSNGLLFSSDAFGLVDPTGPTGANGVADQVGGAAAATVGAFLAARFDWVNRVNSMRLVEALDKLIGELAIEMVLPSHGMIVSGSSAVTSFLRTVREALLPAEPFGLRQEGEPGRAGRSSQAREA